MTSFEEFVSSLGPVTKFITGISIASTCAFVFGIVDPSYIIVNLSDTLFKLQLWRLLTASTFLGKFGFPWLINVGMLLMYTKNHEDFYAGRRAELVWMFSIIIAALHVIAYFMNLKLLAFSFIMAMVWVYCRRNEGQQFKIYSFSFGATIFPWALIVFHLVMGQDITNDLIGVVAGHFYFFFHDVQPLTNGGRNYLATPQWMYSIFPVQNMGTRGIYTAAEARPAAQGAGAQPAGGHRWTGTGRRLGDDNARGST